MPHRSLLLLCDHRKPEAGHVRVQRISILYKTKIHQTPRQTDTDMDLAALCSFLVSLRVFPSRVQFFQYESVYLSCGDETNASEWTIMRNTTRHTNQKNPAQNKSSWYFNSNLYYRDAGVYWCQSEDGQCGAVVNITVTAGDVILESPPLPVTEGHTVTLRCIWNPDKPRTEGTFEFFKDGSCVGNSSSGNLTIPSASHSDSGLYTCSHQGALSAESPLHVLKTAGSPPQLSDGPASVLAYSSVLIVALTVAAATVPTVALLVCVWRRRKLKEREKPDTIYANVATVETPQPKELTDLKTGDDSEFYSTLQLNFM
ncbi:low affinity immunoglobulin gamma Fc region receptor II-a-like isoform X3 [Boleophthalmus pectinirostris]|uniref:low affinity immunoglobulin gamma Fc region receptor II-a-like isoform X3 n=1 Tax=Boleophthalmus pectinirostris TaxID=150288 RepID=UPI00242D342D|nr:low affinity immunoglobulin gamma Fc region receptor II-a-like isoform X3 [Boleophthalmus pectinirostris]